MKTKQSNQNNSLVLVPEEFLETISATQTQILDLLNLERKPKENLGEFISEADASKLIGRKTTWFWILRKEGKLPFTKVGNKVFYERKNLLHLFEQNKKGGSNE